MSEKASGEVTADGQPRVSPSDLDPISPPGGSPGVATQAFVAGVTVGILIGAAVTLAITG